MSAGDRPCRMASCSSVLTFSGSCCSVLSSSSLSACTRGAIKRCFQVFGIWYGHTVLQGLSFFTSKQDKRYTPVLRYSY